MGIVTVAALAANVDTGANAAITVRCTVPRRLPRDGEGLARHHVMSQLVHYEARASAPSLGGISSLVPEKAAATVIIMDDGGPVPV